MKRVNIILLVVFGLITIFSLFGIYELKFKEEFQHIKEIKKIHYSEKTALENIEKNQATLVTHDINQYKLDKKYRFTKQFGFRYQYEPEPDDFLFDENIVVVDEDGTILNPVSSNQYSIRDYNWEIEKYLTSLDSAWHKKIAIIEDSLKFLKIDKVRREYPIDIQSLKVPKEEKLPQSMLETIEELKYETERLFRTDEEDKNTPLEITQLTQDFILDKIDNDKNFAYVWKTPYWLVHHYQESLIKMIARVSDNTEIGLTNTANFTIPERCEAGDLDFHSHGGSTLDDLFKVGGRANHFLKKLTGEDFGTVSMYHTEADLKRIQQRWAHWLKKLNKSKFWF